MHIVILWLYAVTLWLALLAYCVILGASVLPVLLLSPVLISGFIGLLVALDLFVSLVSVPMGRFLRWLWRSLATCRPWRSEAEGAARPNGTSSPGSL